MRGKHDVKQERGINNVLLKMLYAVRIVGEKAGAEARSGLKEILSLI